jgi:hypothetical protein
MAPSRIYEGDIGILSISLFSCPGKRNFSKVMESLVIE